MAVYIPLGTKRAEANAKGKKGQTNHRLADDWFPIRAKQMDKVGRPDVDQLCHFIEDQNCQRGFFEAFG